MQALENVRIADLTAYIAGAYTTQLYADLGALVDKVEPFDGDPFRLNGAMWMAWNRGKRSMVVDLKLAEGREVFYRLLDRCQMVAENFRPGVAERLGVDYKTLKARKPDIVYTRSLAFGTRGPMSAYPGFDPILQSLSGQMAAQGGAGQPPVYYKVGVNDYLGAMNAAFAGALGLFHHARTGQGQEVEATMISAALLAQAGEAVWYQGKPDRDEGGQEIGGIHPAWRLYEARDGWVMIACARADHWRGLIDVLGLAGSIAALTLTDLERLPANEYAVAGLIAAAVRGWAAEALIDALDRRGVPAAPNPVIPDLFEDPHVRQDDLIRPFEHPRYGTVLQPGALIKLSETPGKPEKPAPMLGEHTREILAELEYSRAEMDALLARNVVGQQGENIHSPWGAA